MQHSHMDPLFGLSSLHPQVAQAVASIYGHHRTPWFERVLADIDELLRPALGDRFTPLFLTCTGAGGREAAVANLVCAPHRVVATEGAMERLAAAWGAEVLPIQAVQDPNGRAFDAVFIEHVAPDGTLVDVAAVAAAVHRAAPETPIVLDASVSFGSDFCDAAATGADAVIIVPERALMGIPGLTIVAVTDGLIDTVERRRPELTEGPFLFDLLSYRRAWARKTTPYSPNISACVALQAALTCIDASGGLARHQLRQAVRASAIRDCLAEFGLYRFPPGPVATHAFTACECPGGTEVLEASRILNAAGFGTCRVDGGGNGFQIAHAGYLAPGAVEHLPTVLEAVVTPTQGASLAMPSTSASRPASTEVPFTIPAAEFAAQAQLHARKSQGERAAAKVIESARRVFRDRHAVHDEALQHRTIGFIGAGRIVQHAVTLCQQRGIANLQVYSPSLSRVRSGKQASKEDDQRHAEWQHRGVNIVAEPEEIFSTSHAVVLLPVVYDDRALQLFRKPLEYRNVGLVGRDLIAGAKRAGRLDLIVNAAARGALVDRKALTDAVREGWLRYYSDEIPSDGDPLLDCEGARFTGHVGGSCRAPQAAVARNTHKILRQAIALLLDRALDSADDADYVPCVVNGHLAGDSIFTRLAAARAALGDGRIRMLLTDPFDVESLAFDRLQALGCGLDIHDVSAEALSPAGLADTLGAVRPHIVMLRSRTTVDDGVAAAMTEIPGLAFVIRPGVGVDNLYEGMERLSAHGVQIINEPYGNSAAVAEMALHFILSGTESTLLAPGPTNFNPDVFDVASRYTPEHPERVREAEASVNRTLGAWLGADDDAVTISGPGTALMEAAIAGLTLPRARGLIISHGKFGDRFAEIAAARGRPCEILRVPEPEWGTAVGPDDIERTLKGDADLSREVGRPAISFVCFQQNETSSGVTYHQDSIRELVRIARTHNPDTIVIVDAISGALAHRLDASALDVDALFLGSQKALGVSSGLAFAVLSARAREAMVRRSGYSGSLEALAADPRADAHLDEFDRLQHVHSISLLRLLVAQHTGQFVDTPSIFHLFSTARALELFGAEGGADAVAARHARLARMAREGVARLGLRTMAASPYESDSVTVAMLPDGVPASTIRKAMARETGIAVAGAQGDYWKASMIRIGTLGFVTESDVVRCLRALGAALAEAGHLPAAAVDAGPALSEASR